MGKNRRNKLNWKARLVILVGILGIFVGILGIFAGIIVYLDWAWDTYGRDYALSLASLFVATAVVIVALWSLKLTRDSLKLTRTTTRPFLTITGGKYEGVIQRMQLRIENTGLLPADDISLEIETIEPKNIVSSLGNPIDISVSIFPNEYKTEIIAVNAKLSAEVNSGAELKVLVKITYYFAGESHHTNRMLHLPPSKTGRHAEEQLDFLSEGNYWD